MKWLSLLFIAFGFVSAQADPPIKAGTSVQVEAWDAASKTYDIVMPQYEAQGPNYAKLEDLAAAVGTIDLARAKKKPDSLVGNEYVLEKDLKLQPTARVDALRKAKKKK